MKAFGRRYEWHGLAKRCLQWRTPAAAQGDKYVYDVCPLQKVVQTKADGCGALLAIPHPELLCSDVPIDSRLDLPMKAPRAGVLNRERRSGATTLGRWSGWQKTVRKGTRAWRTQLYEGGDGCWHAAEARSVPLGDSGEILFLQTALLSIENPE